MTELPQLEIAASPASTTTKLPRCMRMGQM
jgi:hypothetical protein